MPWSQNVAVILRAGNTIINPSGIFSYSPSPGAGNLVSSEGATAAGTDQYGNAYLPGQVSYTNAGLFWSAQQTDGATLTWYQASSEAGPWTAESSIGFSFNNITGGGLVFSCPAGISGTFTLPFTSPVISNLGHDNNSGSTFVSGERAQMNSIWADNANTSFSDILNWIVGSGLGN